MNTYIYLVVVASSTIALPLDIDASSNYGNYVSITDGLHNSAREITGRNSLRSSSESLLISPNYPVESETLVKKKLMFGLNRTKKLSPSNKVFKKPYKLQNKRRDSEMYFIKLPPNPYIFVPGFGYISHSPQYNLPKIEKPGSAKRNQLPVTKVPIDFVSNGKPISVYSYTEDKISEPDSNSTVTLNDGPYVFNGVPIKLYLLHSSGPTYPRKHVSRM